MKMGLWLKGSASVLGFCMAMSVQSAQAQDEDSRSVFDNLNTIVVTGTKTQNAENVQDVPVAVTAFNSQSLEALKVRDIQSLSYNAPNVSLDQVGTSRGTANFAIRGLGINSSIPSIDPTVGVFVDGVYLGSNAGVVFDIFDLDSIEILRGPQGILFGKNTTGGAVLINTGNPTADFSGKFRAAVDGPLVDGGRGTANYTVSGVVSGPLVEDTLLFKLGAYYNKDDGYFKNLYDGSNHGRADTKILRGALEGRFGDLMIRGKLDYFTSDGDGAAAQNHGIFERDSFDFATDTRGNYDNEIWTGSLTAELDIGPGTLTNIFGYRSYSATTLGDIDATPVKIFNSDTETEQEQYSNELRYAISTDQFDLTVGGFWFDQTLDYTENRDITGLPEFHGGGALDQKSLGLFAAGQFHVTDALSVIAGVRWSKDTKDVGVTYVRPRPDCSVVSGTCPTTGTNPYFAGEPNGYNDKKTWTNWSPKIGLQYEFSAGQVYGHWTRGYRAGGYNFRNTAPTAFEAIVAASGKYYFDDEKVDNYEIGGKFQTADGSFTLNLAAYYTDISNMQREVNGTSATSGVAQSIFNTADAHIKGFEAEGRMQVSDKLLVTANLGLIDDTYDKIFFDISGNVQNDAGVVDERDYALRIPRVPKVTWGVGFIHELDLGSSEIVTRANFQYRDKVAFLDNNWGWIQEANMLDVNISWNTPVDGLSLSLYGKNLLDEVQIGGDSGVPFGGPLSNGVNRPFDPYPGAGTFSPLVKGRLIGLEATFEF